MFMNITKKILATILVISILGQLPGCYSMQEIQKDEINGLANSGDLIVHTNDSAIYFYEKDNYQFSADSIFGRGYVKYKKSPDFHYSEDNEIAMKNIKTLQQEQLNPVATWSIIGGISLAVIVGLIVLFGSQNNNTVSVVQFN